MANLFTSHDIIGQIVTKFPKSADTFKAYKIDFCCGGNIPLSEACQAKNISADEVIEKINSAYTKAKELNEEITDFTLLSSSELVDYIIQTHHNFLNEEFPALSPYVTKVLRVHGANHPHLLKVHRLFSELNAEMVEHMIQEETIDFPTILSYEENPSEELKLKVKTITDNLLEDHQRTGDILAELREITNDFTPPEGACRTFQLVYNRLQAIEEDVHQHVHLENNILFERFI
ncbi:MAG: iron-sulfur cluster repair di-iron protein [Lactovum sp.]